MVAARESPRAPLGRSILSSAAMMAGPKRSQPRLRASLKIVPTRTPPWRSCCRCVQVCSNQARVCLLDCSDHASAISWPVSPASQAWMPATTLNHVS